MDCTFVGYILVRDQYTGFHPIHFRFYCSYQQSTFSYPPALFRSLQPCALLFFNVHKNIIRHASIKSIGKITLALLLKEVGLLIVSLLGGDWIEYRYLWACCFIDLLISIVVLVGFRVTLLLVYDLVVIQIGRVKKTNVLIYGTDDKSVSLQQRMYTSKHYQVVGYINPNQRLKSYRISDLPVYFFKTKRTSLIS